jgi:histone deacetylase complex subunit SAP30
MIQNNGRQKRKRKDSEDDQQTDGPEVDLGQLQVNTLRRYKRHYRLQTRPGLNKAQLVESIVRHFKSTPVTEKETLTYFIYMAKTHKSKFDQPSNRYHDSPT